MAAPESGAPVRSSICSGERRCGRISHTQVARQPRRSPAGERGRLRPRRGRDWKGRKARLASGHNADYWIAKIERNMARDLEQRRELKSAGWRVIRFWESAIRKDPSRLAAIIHRLLRTASRS